MQHKNNNNDPVLVTLPDLSAFKEILKIITLENTRKQDGSEGIDFERLKRRAVLVNTLLFRFGTPDRVMAAFDQCGMECTDDERKRLMDVVCEKYAEYKSAIEHIMKLRPNDFAAALDNYCRAFYLNVAGEADCIALISDDSQLQKIQLQIALGVLANDPGRLNKIPTNHCLLLQKELITKIKDTEFLTDLLRDFIIRSCDGGQICCPNASATIAMLIAAGANPYVDRLSLNYHSPGYLFVAMLSGNTLFDELGYWVDSVQDAASIVAELKKSTLRQPEKSCEEIFTNIAFRNLNGDSRDYGGNTESALINELIDQRNTGVTELTAIIGRVNQQIEPLIAANQAIIGFRERVIGRLRQAEGRLLEAIYIKEHAYELQLAKYTHISLMLSPLILPLFVAGILALTRYLHMRDQHYTVDIEELSFAQLEAKKSKQITNQPCIPLHKADGKLKAAIVINEDSLRVRANYSRRDLPSLFHGTSKINVHGLGHLTQDARIYKPRKL